MSKKTYLTLMSIGLAGGTVLADTPVELTDGQAEKLLASGSVTGPIEGTPDTVVASALLQLPAEEFTKQLGKLNLPDLQSVAAGMELDTVAAKTKAEFVTLIKAARGIE